MIKLLEQKEHEALVEIRHEAFTGKFKLSWIHDGQALNPSNYLTYWLGRYDQCLEDNDTKASAYDFERFMYTTDMNYPEIVLEEVVENEVPIN